jgi:hypothetical protein
MALRLEKFSYRFAEQVLNSRLSLKQEIEDVISIPPLVISSLSRPGFNKQLETRFIQKGWQSQPLVFDNSDDPAARMDFLKERVGIEVAFGHASFIGIDLLKLQVASYSGLDKIDVGVYIVTTKSFQSKVHKEFGLNWEGSLSFEKVKKYLPFFKSAIQIPIYVIGIDL